MSRLIFLILLLLGSPVAAQQANFNYQSQTSAPTTQVVGTFTNVVTAQTGRQSCWIQFRPLSALTTAAPTNQGFVFFGQTAPASQSSAFALNPYQILTCEQANEVDGSGIWITSSTTADTFTIKVK